MLQLKVVWYPRTDWTKSLFKYGEDDLALKKKNFNCFTQKNLLWKPATAFSDSVLQYWRQQFLLVHKTRFDFQTRISCKVSVSFYAIN